MIVRPLLTTRLCPSTAPVATSTIGLTWIRAEAFVDLTTLLRVTRKIDTRKDDVKRIRLDKVASGILFRSRQG